MRHFFACAATGHAHLGRQLRHQLLVRAQLLGELLLLAPPEVPNLRWASLGRRVSLLAARNISTGEQLLMPLTRDSPFYGSDSSEFQNFNDATPRLMTQNDD